MNALHLLWVISIAVTAGAFCMALLAVNKNLQTKQKHHPAGGATTKGGYYYGKENLLIS